MVTLGVTVTIDVFFSLLCYEVASLLKLYGIQMNSAWFQQDDARPHTSNAVLHFLRDITEE
jgi:hypothetical protein